MQQPDNNVLTFAKKTASDSLAQSVTDKNLYQRCEELTISQLKVIIQRMFENADDTLFKLMEKAEKTNEQTVYFDSMRIVRLQRGTIEAIFLDLVKQNFSASHTGRENTETDIANISLEGISLVEEGDLEESIAIKNMITKIRYQYAEEISALDKRLALLKHEANWQEEKNPLSPECICHAFMKATNTLDVGLKVSLIILKLFEIHIGSSINPLYTAVNQLCIDAGVLPKIKLIFNKIPSQAGVPGHTNPAAPANSTGADMSPSDLHGKSTPAGDTSFTSLHNLLNNYRQGNCVNSQPRFGAQPQSGNYSGYQQGQMNPGMSHSNGAGVKHNDYSAAATSIELAAFLSGMQSSDTQAGYESISELPAGEGVASIPRGGLKQYVVTHLEKQGKGSHTLQPLDNDVIDIVSMLFEYILDDDIMADVAKALLGKLQIPLLKAAIMDKEFFASKGHPARTLLNEMAKSSLAITEACADDATSLITELKRIVQTIIVEFKEDLSIFETLLHEFRLFMAQQDAVETTMLKKVAAKFKQKEDLALASKWVEESLNTALQQHHFPQAVLDIIAGPWKQVMLKTYLNQGQDSDTWKSQLRFIEILDWSIQPKRASMDRSKLASIIYHLVSTLRNGLDTIGVSMEEIEKTLAQLEPYHYASIKGLRHYGKQSNLMNSDSIQAEDLATQFVYSTHQDKLDSVQNGGVNVAVEKNLSLDDITGTIHEIECQLASLAMLDEPVSEQAEALAATFDGVTTVTDRVLMEDIILAGYDAQNYDPAEQPQDEYLELARHLEQGKWVEFTGKNNHKVRAKLAWKSELLGEFTFLDWKYSVVADKTLYGLAADLRRGTAEIIDDIPIMDRALSAVMQTLSGNARR